MFLFYAMSYRSAILLYYYILLYETKHCKMQNSFQVTTHLLNSENIKVAIAQLCNYKLDFSYIYDYMFLTRPSASENRCKLYPP